MASSEAPVNCKHVCTLAQTIISNPGTKVLASLAFLDVRQMVLEHLKNCRKMAESRKSHTVSLSGGGV